MNINPSIEQLTAVSVLSDKAGRAMQSLSSNIGDVLKDTDGRGLDYRTYLINNFPVVNWLLGTALTARTRQNIFKGHGLDNAYKDGDGNLIFKVPKDLVWSNPVDDPSGATQECCWIPFDFAKCGQDSPIKLLCLKDQDNMLDFLVSRDMNTGTDNLEGLAATTLKEEQKNVAKLSMAFLTALTIMQGSPNVAVSNLLKPFNGLASIFSSNAITSWDGSNIYGAFESLGCRLQFMTNMAGYVFTLNPLVYESLKTYIQPGQLGQMPQGWEKDANGELKYKGISFIPDAFVPYDMDTGTGEIWLMNSENLGCILGTNLIPDERFIFETHIAKNANEGCMENTTYYYNYGGCIVNNYSKLAKIVNVPVTSACQGAIGDLGNLINPRTIAPNL